jgi:hypothetical protein
MDAAAGCASARADAAGIASDPQSAAPPTSSTQFAGRLHAGRARAARRNSQRSKLDLIIVASPFDNGHAWPIAFNAEGASMLARRCCGEISAVPDWRYR